MLQHLTGQVCPPLSRPRLATTAVIDGEGKTCELNVTKWLIVQRGSAIIQGHMPVHSWEIWLKWRRYEWSSWVVIRWLPPQCWPSDLGHFPDDFHMASFDHVHSSSFLADILTYWVLIWCILYTVFRKKHPLTFSFISPWVMCRFKQKLQWIYLRNDRFWQCRN